MLWPMEGHHQQAHRFEAQVACTLPTRKKLWAAIVKAKLLNQAAVLQATGAAHAPLQALAKQVRSGDPDNLEAQGARKYWGLLMGTLFRRDQQADGVNALLNYGYTVLRAATARAVVAAENIVGGRECNVIQSGRGRLFFLVDLLRDMQWFSKKCQCLDNSMQGCKSSACSCCS